MHRVCVAECAALLLSATNEFEKRPAKISVAPVGITDPDAVIDRFPDAAVEPFALAQRLLRPLALRDVLDHRVDSQCLSRGISEHRGRKLGPNHVTLLVEITF